MKSEYTFDSFYVYEGNKVALSAAKKIVEFPGVVFNPLFIHGAKGLGKTHLLSAINFQLKKKHSSDFLTAEQFEKKIESQGVFNSPLLVDDIHLVNDKYQKRLKEVVEHALKDNIQVCFSSDVAPHAVSGFDSKLRNLIEGGLICELSAPEEPIRREIIRREADESGIILSDDIVDELARIPIDSVGTIENMIKRLVTYSSLGNLAIDANSIRLILKGLFSERKPCSLPSLLREFGEGDIWTLKDIDAPHVKEEYERRISLWERKGFNVSFLKHALSDDTLDLRRSYHEYVERIRRLIQLQTTFAGVDRRKSPTDAVKVESKLLDPDKIEEIEDLLKIFDETKGTMKERRKFNEFILGFCNKMVWDAYHEEVLDNLGMYNPFVILGNTGTGKTHFLEAVCDDLISREKSVKFRDLARESDSELVSSAANYDVLILDNFDVVFSASESFINDIGELIDSFRDEGKQVIIASVPADTGTGLPPSLKGIFDEGKVVELEKPSADVIIEYIKRKAFSEADEFFDEGIPEFESFYEIEYFLRGAGREEEAIVSLGLPGEDETAEIPIDAADDISGEKPVRISETESKVDLHDDINYMLPEVQSELLAEKF